MMISERGREYREDVVAITARAGLLNFGIEGAVSVGMVLHPPDRRKRDEDNYTKPTYDAITHAGVWLDDSQVKHSERWMAEICKGGLLVLQIRQKFDPAVPSWGEQERGQQDAGSRQGVADQQATHTGRKKPGRTS